MTDPFDGPGSGNDAFQPKTHLGDLLLITPDKIVPNVVTDYGVSDVTEADVAVLDGDMKGTTYTKTYIFAKFMQSQLRSKLGGGQVLGRLGQGEAKKGQSPPWQLESPTEEDRVIARKYLAYIESQKEPVAASSDPF
jgi:hypothetical protein